MMHVHYNASETCILQLKDDTFEQRFSPTLTKAFGIRSVRGFRRVPKPAANIIACIIAK